MKIVQNDKDHLDDFIRLNEQWISKYFELEAADRALAANPWQIVERGGYIFTAHCGGDVVGVCALFNEGDGVFELARMAVSPAAQGKGIGDELMRAALSRLSQIGASRVYLLSNTVLEAAVSLYKKYGFRTASTGQHPVYSRANIVMERDIS